jgi:hypothetical protein
MNIALACLCAVAILVLLPTKVEAPRSGWYRPASGDYKSAVLTFTCPEKDRIKKARERMEKVKQKGTI